MANEICRLDSDEVAILQELEVAYNNAISDLKDFLENVQSEWEGELGGRSEKWQESDAGTEAQGRLDIITGWIETLDSADLGINTAEIS